MNLTITHNLLTEEEVTFLKGLTKVFVRSTNQGTLNVDNRMVIQEENKLASYLQKVDDFLKSYDQKYERTGDVWMTNVDEFNIAKNDEFHLDVADISVVTYFENNFTGGEFQYLDNNEQLITLYPEPQMTIVMADKTYHRVCNVKSGIRYSLTAFYNVIEKKTKSLL